MSDTELAALVLIAVWLALLSLAVLIVIRQLGFITLQLHGSGLATEDGPIIGTVLSSSIVAAVPELAVGLHYLIFLATDCRPCLNFASELTDSGFTHPDLVVVYSGGNKSDDKLADLLPAAMRRYEPDRASLLQDQLTVNATPSILQVEEGVIVGKGLLRSVSDVRVFIDAYEFADTREIARINKEAFGNARG